MGNFIASCCHQSEGKERHKLNVSDSSEASTENITDIKDNQIAAIPQNFNPSLAVTVDKLDTESTSSHSEVEEEEEEEKDDDTKDATQKYISEEYDFTDEQKNKDESSVMVENGSFAPAENDANDIDKDNEKVNESVTQVEEETLAEGNNVESE